MTIFPRVELKPFYQQAYQEGFVRLGDLDLSFTAYTSRLTDILNHNLPPGAAAHAAITLLERLHTADLYLAIACAQGSNVAWRRLAQLYQDHLREVTRRVCSSRRMADELAESAIGHVYLPDASGRSRIASFDGRSSLGFWLAVVVKRLAIRERQRKCNRLECLNDYLDVIDRRSVARLEAHVRRHRYQALIRDSLTQMAGHLSPRELLILQLHYLRGLRASEIAGLLEVHRSSITRQLERTHSKLKEAIIAGLLAQQPLSAAAVEECLAEMLEDPEYALFALSTIG
jgi:RNA polymerase sigma-70 factor (ECF subfamily)